MSEIGKGNYRVIAETHKKLDVPNEAQVLTRVLVRDKCCWVLIQLKAEYLGRIYYNTLFMYSKTKFYIPKYVTDF